LTLPATGPNEGGSDGSVGALQLVQRAGLDRREDWLCFLGCKERSRSHFLEGQSNMGRHRHTVR
ncbi:MAG TPA: hypothetical protein VIX20_13930, partial [Ktedonobacteraceae bacterium]